MHQPLGAQTAYDLPPSLIAFLKWKSHIYAVAGNSFYTHAGIPNTFLKSTPPKERDLYNNFNWFWSKGTDLPEWLNTEGAYVSIQDDPYGYEDIRIAEEGGREYQNPLDFVNTLFLRGPLSRRYIQDFQNPQYKHKKKDAFRKSAGKVDGGKVIQSGSMA